MPVRPGRPKQVIEKQVLIITIKVNLTQELVSRVVFTPTVMLTTILPLNLFAQGHCFSVPIVIVLPGLTMCTIRATN